MALFSLGSLACKLLQTVAYCTRARPVPGLQPAGAPAETGALQQGADVKDKEQIVDNWLPRYTGVPLDGFGEHILLTNFGGYLGHFSRLTGAEIVGIDRPMPSATARSEERRVGKECRSRWWPYDLIKKKR